LREVKVGVIGCGKNSPNHLRVYARSPGVRLEAVCDRAEGNATAMARQYGAKQAFKDPQDMLKLDLDLVDIITPAETHAPLAVEALESGHNVLVEKPMTLASEDGVRMISAARRSGRTLCVNHNKRFYGCVLEAKRRIIDQDLKVSRARVTDFFVYSHERPAWTFTKDSGGILWEAMIHHAYLLECFLGEIDRVHAVGRAANSPVLDSITFLVSSQGRAGLSEFEWSSRYPLFSFQAFTEDGTRFDGDFVGDFVLEWPRTRGHVQPMTVQRFSDDLAVPLERWRSRVRKSTRLPVYGAVSPYKRTFYALIGRYLSFIRGEEQSTPVPAEDGLRAVRVLEAAQESIRTGLPQDVVRSPA
jgi:predicted dehydrogenase